jgi:hypothetical protein
MTTDLVGEATNGVNANSSAAIELSPALNAASVLPENIRKKLMAIKSPVHEISHVYSYNSGAGGIMNYRVDALVVNKTQIFAVKAKQEIHLYAGESESSAASRLNSAPWNLEMIYEKFA